MFNRLTQLTATAATALALSAGIAHQAQAISFNFDWTGDAGYSARGMFGYDETTAPAIISESGAGPTDYLDFLMVSFFDPDGNLTQSFNTVSGGVSNSTFFQFNFDTTTHTLFGEINIGGGTGVMGEQFFSGTIGGLLRLRAVEEPGISSTTLDSQDPGEITVSKKVPEPASILGLLALGLAGFASARQQKKA